MEGWIKLHREIANWRWATSPNHLILFLQILIRANFKPTHWRKELIQPGQLLTGRKQLSSWTGLSEMQIRTALRDLQSTQELTIKTTKNYSIITILNWDKYQGDTEQDNHQNNQQITNKQPTDNQQITTSKNANNAKNVKNAKNNIISCEFEQNLTEVKTSSVAQNVLTLLNTACSSHFRPVKSNMTFINARLNEGYKFEDFKSVVEHKQATWGNDAKMSAYLRPSTLFGTKFDSYLQESKNPFTAKFGPRSKTSPTLSVVTPEELARAKELGII